MRKAPSAKTLKLLFVKSGNVCAFPECDHPIFNDEGLYIAQLCHIEAAEQGGPRYNPSQTEEKRRSPENLLFMCHRHHKETDQISTYELRRIKENHELIFTEKGREATQNMIRQVQFEINTYWRQISLKTFEIMDLKIERDFEKGILELFEELEDHIKSLIKYGEECQKSDSEEVLDKDLNILFSKADLDIKSLDKIPYYENPFSNRNWELHNLGRLNLNTHIRLTIKQLKVKVLESILLSNTNNKELEIYLKKIRDDFENDYSSSYYFD